MSISRSMTRGGKRPGAGRKKLKPDERQNVLLGLRIRPDQVLRYQDAAGLEGLDVLDWARKHLDAAAARALDRK